MKNKELHNHYINIINDKLNNVICELCLKNKPIGMWRFDPIMIIMCSRCVEEFGEWSKKNQDLLDSIQSSYAHKDCESCIKGH